MTNNFVLKYICY